MRNIWFDCQIVTGKIEHLSNIDEMQYCQSCRFCLYFSMTVPLLVITKMLGLIHHNQIKHKLKNAIIEWTLVFPSFISLFRMHFFSFSINSWLNSRSCRDVCLEFNAKIMKNSSGMHGPLLLKASKEIKCWEEVKSWIGTYILVSQFLFFWALFNYIQQ